MLKLSNYIANKLICESNFFAEDKALADLEPKMQDVQKFRLLVTKYDDLGEEIPIAGDEHYAGKQFEQLENAINDDTSHAAAKKKIKDAESMRNKWWSNHRAADEKTKEYIKEASKAYGGYVDAVYSWAKQYATTGRGRNKYVDTRFIVMTFLGLGSWIINYGMSKNIEDILLGKLIKKFDKDMGKENPVSGASKFLQMYDEKKILMQKALDVEKNTLKTIEDLKEERKKHKYTIIGNTDSDGGAIHIYFFDNSKFESFDEIMDSKPMKDVKWTGNSANKLLRKIAEYSNRKEKIGTCALGGGYYTFNQNKDNGIPLFGFIDELPNEIYEYSLYTHKLYYRGKLYKESYGYSYFDSLWSVYNKKN